jgi:hypothetical protein
MSGRGPLMEVIFRRNKAVNSAVFEIPENGFSEK